MEITFGFRRQFPPALNLLLPLTNKIVSYFWSNPCSSYSWKNCSCIGSKLVIFFIQMDIFWNKMKKFVRIPKVIKCKVEKNKFISTEYPSEIKLWNFQNIRHKIEMHFPLLRFLFHSFPPVPSFYLLKHIFFPLSLSIASTSKFAFCFFSAFHISSSK